MHKLDRTAIAAPGCLADYQHGKHTWEHVTPADKQQIRVRLGQMQGVLCAYCEGDVYTDGHVEHFRRKNPDHFPELTFVWSNLFLSCGSHAHCGHYKDRPRGAPYDPNDLVKPDEDEPDEFFYFHSSGEIRVREGIHPDKQARAAETIRVFHLDENVLRWDRWRAVKQYEKNSPGILDDLMAFGEEDRLDFIQTEIEATRTNPHWTVIRHYFEKAH